MKKSLSLFLILLIISSTICTHILDTNTFSFSKTALLKFKKINPKQDKSNIEKKVLNSENSTVIKIIDKSPPTPSDKTKLDDKVTHKTSGSKEVKENIGNELTKVIVRQKKPERKSLKDTPTPKLRELFSRSSSHKPTELAKRMTTKVVPKQSALDLAKNLVYAFGTYTIPTQMWYYHKKFILPNTTFYYITPENKLDNSVVFNQVILLPREMKELRINYLAVYMIINGFWNNHNCNYYIKLNIDNNTVDDHYKSITDQGYGNGQHKYSQSLELSGTIYNVPAGEHTITVNMVSECGYYMYFGYIYNRTTSQANTQLSMVGYPTS